MGLDWWALAVRPALLLTILLALLMTDSLRNKHQRWKQSRAQKKAGRKLATDI